MHYNKLPSSLPVNPESLFMTDATIETTIPFSGFYESVHLSLIESAIESMFSDDSGGSLGLENAFNDLCDFRKVFYSYAQCYAENFSVAFKIPSLKFETLESPREYNFTTDRVFCKISMEDVKAIYERLSNTEGRKVFEDVAKSMFTSRSGFYSFYSPDVEDWGDIEDWDANQIGCMLHALASYDTGKDYDSWEEYALMEDMQSNGYIDNWLCGSSPGVDRLFKIREYLIKRQDR